MDINWSKILEKIQPWLLDHGIKIAAIIIVGFIVDKVLERIIERAVRIAVLPDKHSSKDAEIKRENTLIRIFNTTLKIVLATMVTLMVLQEIGVAIGPILAGAGIVGIAFGFGGQYLVRDIITGLFMILENQYRIGDVVSFDGTAGLVEDISLRKTRLRDLDGTVHHVPHGEIKKVANLSKTFARVNLNMGVSYSSDIDQVIEVVNRVGKELAEDTSWKEHIIKAPEFVRVDNFGDSSVDIKILGDTQPLQQWAVTGELRKRLFIAFKKEGIEIPFPQRVIHQIKNQRNE